MFLDGVTYAAIARNLAEGRGRFWTPFYTATIYPAFHEHPPLAFWLQSLFFRLFGDHAFVERLYCAAAACAIAALIARTWRALCPRELDWLPVAFWILVPVVSWTIVGNLLETTMTVFVAAAVASLFVPAADENAKKTKTAKAAEEKLTSRASRPLRSDASHLAAGVISGLCVVAAVLSKGPVGLFPLAAPLFLPLLPERRRHVPWLIAGQWTAVILCAAALFLAPGPRGSLTAYVNEQVMASLAGRRETSGSSFTIVGALLEGVLLPLAIAAGAIKLGASRGASVGPRNRRIVSVFALIGLAGTLPMLISPKQTGHYLMPAVPFYAMAAAVIAAPAVSPLVARAAAADLSAALRITAAVMVAGAVAAIWLPALERDPSRLADLDRLALAAPRGATVGICPNVNGDWGLHAWMQRRFEISLDAGEAAARHDWFLKTRGDSPDCAPAPCVPASDSAGGIVLLRCR